MAASAIEEAALLNRALGLAAGATFDERLERAQRFGQMFANRMKTAKLTEKAATEIRERYLRQGERVVTLAREYGVSEARCYEVIRKKAWKPL